MLKQFVTESGDEGRVGWSQIIVQQNGTDLSQ